MSYPVETYERLAGEAREIIARYPQGHARSALLPMLHLVQSEDGYVSANGIALCAELLGITRAEVSAVATFYTQYKRHPTGEYLVGVCTNALLESEPTKPTRPEPSPLSASNAMRPAITPPLSW